MPSTSRYFYEGSPFIPSSSLPELVDDILKDIYKGMLPVAAICYYLSTVMTRHVESNILPRLHTIHSSFGTDTQDIINLKMGYDLPFDTVLSAASYMLTNSKESTFKDIFNGSVPLFLQNYYRHMEENIDITRDLLIQDCTGILIFMYLEERPYLIDDYFRTGQQCANAMFVSVSQEVVNRLKN